MNKIRVFVVLAVINAGLQLGNNNLLGAIAWLGAAACTLIAGPSRQDDVP